MKNKIVALILIVPLVLMFCVFSAANIASIKVPISVSGVTLFHNQQEIVNLAEGDEFQINAQVLPRNASNKGLMYTYESVDGNPVPILNINNEGFVRASGYGLAKITVTTKDGAYKKSFLLEVTSTLATDIILNLNTTEDIMIGDKFNLIAKILPDETIDKSVKFSSSNNNIVKINSYTGSCTAVSSGKVTLSATTEGLNGKITKDIEVVVLPNASENPITFNGQNILYDKIFTSQFTAIMEVNYTSLYDLGITLNNEDIILEYDKEHVDSVQIVELDNSEGIYKFKLNIDGINTDNFNLKAKINHESFINYVSEISLQKVVDLKELDIHLINFKNYIKKNINNSFIISVLPQDFTDYTVNAYFEKRNITIDKNENIYYYRGTEIGTNVLTIDIVVDNEIIKTFKENVEVLNPPSSIYLSNNLEEYGIENLYTIANEKIQNSQYVINKHQFGFTTSINLENVEFTSSNEKVAIFENNQLKILNEGVITITATELQSKLLGINLSTSMNVRCVNGVEVGSYKDLTKATKDNKQVVLNSDIMLGEKLIDVDENGKVTELKTPEESAIILNEEISQIETTGEWNYYKNNPNKEIKKDTPPLINYIIKFTNNCYGNGFSINANNITNLIDGTGALYTYAKFKGPLDLVALPGASVKAQDNICFIASDNVMINNIELIGANMRGNEDADLNQLNFVGTVLEVMGDNVKIVNSRIRNGRNCVRVYGKECGNYDKINVLIESCIISNAREFLVKMGTNAKIYGDFKQGESINLANGISDSTIWEDCSPRIKNFKHLNSSDLKEKEYNALVNSYNNNQEYLNLIKTNLTIKNCVLHTSGLFSIGIESSFAGPALDGGRYNSWYFKNYGWKDIAGTNYPTMLNLEGDVKLYDWKNISHIDSSTLIEGGLFSFNISSMIQSLYDNGEFTEIITEFDGERYAHGGIVMYGGGKNYAIINNNLEGQEKFENITLSLDSLKSSLTSMLKYASGKEPFRVFMYGKNSTFNYYKQVADLKSGEAFSSVGKYTH